MNSSFLVVSRIVDTVIERLAVPPFDKVLATVINDMQAYTDGAEEDLCKSISEIRVMLGLASHIANS